VKECYNSCTFGRYTVIVPDHQRNSSTVPDLLSSLTLPNSDFPGLWEPIFVWWTVSAISDSVGQYLTKGIKNNNNKYKVVN